VAEESGAAYKPLNVNKIMKQTRVKTFFIGE